MLIGTIVGHCQWSVSKWRSCCSENFEAARSRMGNSIMKNDKYLSPPLK